jgi:hypothetical protein
LKSFGTAGYSSTGSLSPAFTSSTIFVAAGESKSDPTGDVIDHFGRHCISAVVLMNEPHLDPSQFLENISRKYGSVGTSPLNFHQALFFSIQPQKTDAFSFDFDGFAGHEVGW